MIPTKPCRHGATGECEACNAMILRVWFGSGRDHDYGYRMTYDTFIGLDRAISVDDMAKVARLEVGGEIHGKDGDTGEPFTVRRMADDDRCPHGVHGDCVQCNANRRWNMAARRSATESA